MKQLRELPLTVAAVAVVAVDAVDVPAAVADGDDVAGRQQLLVDEPLLEPLPLMRMNDARELTVMMKH